MSHALSTNLLLYAHGSDLVFEYEDKVDIEKQMHINFAVCKWCVDNKLSIPFGEDKTKCIQYKIFSKKIW